MAATTLTTENVLLPIFQEEHKRLARSGYSNNDDDDDDDATPLLTNTATYMCCTTTTTTTTTNHRPNDNTDSVSLIAELAPSLPPPHAAIPEKAWSDARVQYIRSLAARTFDDDANLKKLLATSTPTALAHLAQNVKHHVARRTLTTAHVKKFAVEVAHMVVASQLKGDDFAIEDFVSAACTVPKHEPALARTINTHCVVPAIQAALATSLAAADVVADDLPPTLAHVANVQWVKSGEQEVVQTQRLDEFVYALLRSYRANEMVANEEHAEDGSGSAFAVESTVAALRAHFGGAEAAAARSDSNEDDDDATNMASAPAMQDGDASASMSASSLRRARFFHEHDALAASIAILGKDDDVAALLCDVASSLPRALEHHDRSDAVRFAARTVLRLGAARSERMPHVTAKLVRRWLDRVLTLTSVLGRFAMAESLAVVRDVASAISDPSAPPPAVAFADETRRVIQARYAQHIALNFAYHPDVHLSVQTVARELLLSTM
ncbi:hypothetical protein PPROV_000282700 [Pycnococcus provasolii]|uniref:Uncharacterized protein n=1 Tax=Pycnococcus provasolii TaxID=41880 RepID=A0A830HC58_9CHLO|nr:hypothetical protein PPROV_000282700 [Pycnococcus provasolii]